MYGLMELHGPQGGKEERAVETARNRHYFVNSDFCSAPRVGHAMPGMPVRAYPTITLARSPAGVPGGGDKTGHANRLR